MTPAEKRSVIVLLGPDPQPKIELLHPLKPDETWGVPETRLVNFTHTMSLDACIGKLTLDDPIEIFLVNGTTNSKTKYIFNSHSHEDVEALVSIGNEPHPTSIERVKYLSEKNNNTDACPLAEDKLIYIFKSGGV